MVVRRENIKMHRPGRGCCREESLGILGYKEKPVILATQETRDQEYRCWRPTWANSSQDPISKKPITKKS
jgi:hypothetical protein